MQNFKQDAKDNEGLDVAFDHQSLSFAAEKRADERAVLLLSADHASAVRPFGRSRGVQDWQNYLARLPGSGSPVVNILQGVGSRKLPIDGRGRRAVEFGL